MAVEVEVPGLGRLTIAHVLMDFNGTLAVDGRLVDGVDKVLEELKGVVGLKVVTADTFGTVEKAVKGLAELEIIAPGDEREQKLQVLRRLGAGQTMAIGNGANDELMLREAAVGVVVMGAEGAARGAIAAADVVVPGAVEALELLARPARLKATLRR